MSSYEEWEEKEKHKRETLNWYREEIRGLILILEGDGHPKFVTKEYIKEKLGMILTTGIGFHPYIKDIIRPRRRRHDDA